MKIERTDKYLIHSYDTDLNGVLSLPSLTRFLQETAWLNAEDMQLGYQKFLAKNMAWVLFKQYIKMKRWPSWEDEIEIRTWPSQSDKLFCYREFEIYHKKQLIGQVSTSWLVIDLIKRRPLRTSTFYTENLNLEEKILFPDIIKTKMNIPENSTPDFQQIVRITDIDVNHHVNNSCYTQWCLNSYDFDFIQNHTIIQAEQQFTSEAKFGDTVELHKLQESQLKFKHCIKRDDKSIFLLNLIWEKKDK